MLMRSLVPGLMLAVSLTVPLTAAADTLDQVRETGTLTIGYRQDAAPFSLEQQDGRPAGYSVDLCNAIADAVGEALGIADLLVAYQPVTADSRFDALVDGEIDLLCGATTVTVSRRNTLDFSLLTFVSGATVLVRQDSPIDSLADTAGRRVGVLGGTTTEDALRAALAADGIDAEMVAFTARPDGLEALLAEDIDAFFGDRELLAGLVVASGVPGELRLSSTFLSIEPYALAMRRGDDGLRLIADQTLARMYRDGRIEPIFQRWFVGMQPSNLLQALYLLQGLPE